MSVVDRNNHGRVMIFYDEESPLIRDGAFVAIQKVDGDLITTNNEGAKKKKEETYLQVMLEREKHLGI